MPLLLILTKFRRPQLDFFKRPKNDAKGFRDHRVITVWQHLAKIILVPDARLSEGPSNPQLKSGPLIDSPPIQNNQHDVGTYYIFNILIKDNLSCRH